ncbi:MAG: hypothetical protein CL908_15455 [Deltaproteobacteria bacterium]|nr:hypothetical protein [Deltaproteobacteria bacterium]
MLIFAFLCPALASCGVTARPALEPISLAPAESGSEPDIDQLVQDWFGLLESQLPGAADPEELLPEASFQLALADGTLRGRSGLGVWLADLRTGYEQVEYEIGSIRIDSAGENLQTARFEFSRRAVDETGTPHIARREHRWLLRDLPGDPPRVLRIDERPLLSFPGTGPQIVCY